MVTIHHEFYGDDWGMVYYRFSHIDCDYWWLIMAIDGQYWLLMVIHGD